LTPAQVKNAYNQALILNEQNRRWLLKQSENRQ
jgi:hypothetical protein